MQSVVRRVVVGVCCLVFCFGSALRVAAEVLGGSTSPALPAHVEGLYNPVADTRAVITVGHARFTVLTAQLIRMEWAADGKFEDRASFVFLNRRLPVPRFDSTIGADGRATLHTEALTLHYAPTAMDGSQRRASTLR